MRREGMSAQASRSLPASVSFAKSWTREGIPRQKKRKPQFKILYIVFAPRFDKKSLSRLVSAGTKASRQKAPEIIRDKNTLSRITA